VKRVALALFSSIAGLVMLLGFKTHTGTTSTSASTDTSTTDTGNGQASAGTQPSTGTGSTTSKVAGSKTYTGTAADTRYGPVQVQITLTNGTITKVAAVEYPQSDPRDEQINSYAIPQLNSETLTAQSAKIDMVSGATYTSDGYLQSLQSALDQAGL
jgi:uncharacterized protein with FMN-binding domain